ncbi:META domain-containing protein [Niabella ginsengisoli]|uniref:META domain-containing protein n=1 Tax=Niabella ginsengisoli TaxID=522298 RepID=A0ABS9SQV0_9BACT|nr:META domain-containing protein [Niabella ginsengisoli]MCH5600773.1 META domain-containing protein [Niabella ginsengisoli]
MKQLIQSLTIVILIWASSCGHKNAPLTSSMHTEGLHHKWKIVSMKNAEDNLPDVYIDLRDVYHSGATAGCQYFSFTPKFGHNSRIKIDNISTHLAACSDGSLDNILLSNLKDVATFSLVNSDLKFFATDGSTLFKGRKAADDEKGSVNRKWYIQTMINANNEQLLKDTAFIDLTDFDKGTGSVGCNRFSFAVTADDTYNISIGNAISTRMFCQDAAVNESVFTKVLPLVSKYQVIGNRLKLFDKANTLLIEAEERL